MVRRTALGGFLVAGGVVLGQSAAGAEEASTGTSGPTETSTTGAVEPGATDTSSSVRWAESTSGAEKPAVQEATTEPAAGPAKAAATTKAGATAKAGGTRKVAAKPRPAASRRPVAPVRKVAVKPAVAPGTAAPARTVTVTVKAAPAKPTPKPVTLTAAATTTFPPAQGAATLDAAPTGGSTPLDGSGGPADGTISGLAIVPTSGSSLAAGATEIDSGQPVAGGSPPPDDTDEAATAPANLALVSTVARFHPPVLTGTSPSGDLTITIDQPLPGTVVPAGTPVLVTGTVGGTPVPVNFIYLIDVSRATLQQGACGAETSILECEVAGLTALNEANAGPNPDVEVSVVAFGAVGLVQDVDPTTAGIQTTTLIGADVDEDGVPDVVQALGLLGSSGTPTNYDTALLAVQAQIVEGEVNVVFLASDGQSEGDIAPTTGPGSPLQALIDAGVTIFTFGFAPAGGECAAGQPLAVLAVNGGGCIEVDDPATMGMALAIDTALPVDRVEIEVNGFFGIADLDPSGRFSILIPAGLLEPGRNDIIARAFGAAHLEGEVAEANTFVIVTTPMTGGPRGVPRGPDRLDLDLDRDRVTVRVADLDEAKPRRARAGNLPVTGSGADHLAGTGVLSFLLGGLLLGGGRHLRRRRRSGAPA